MRAHMQMLRGSGTAQHQPDGPLRSVRWKRAVGMSDEMVQAVIAWSDGKPDTTELVHPDALCPCSKSEDGCGQEMWSGADAPDCMCEGFVCLPGRPHIGMEAGDD